MLAPAPAPALALGFLLAFASAGWRHHLVVADDCPLDFSWSNITLASPACSNTNERGKCCRYINAFIAISIAHYANATGKLGVPSAFTEVCLTSISKTFNLYGISASATAFCGLGPKVRVSYECEGRATVLEMMQSPIFNTVIESCKPPLSLDDSCKRCLNSGILYLHQLIPTDDNVTLSICRNAVFVTLANQGDENSAIHMATCFFGVEGLNILPGSSSKSPTISSSPSVDSVQAPIQQVSAVQTKKIQHNYHLDLIPGIGIVVIVVATLMLVLLIFLIRNKSRELKRADASIKDSWDTFPPAQSCRVLEGPSPMLRRFDYNEMSKATKNFSTFIGKGGFGTVFKAQLSDGSLAAVKRMNKVSKQGEEEFCREIELLARLHHRHLVALKGFCIERNERFLVYEYMENGSLKDHLHSPGRNSLNWNARLQIAIDIANALEYLHFYCDPPLCHRDIKSSNILLDENFVAKVADFGLAHASRSGSITFEPVNTDIRGTPGYMDPEYVVTQELTEKSDIYSYGVLLLELVTGRRVIQDNRNLVSWSQKFMGTDSRLPELVDPTIGNSFDFEQLHMVAGIIQWCTQREGRGRPSIKQVLRMFSERLDSVQNGFITDEEDNAYFGGRASKSRIHRSEIVPYSGDARCLPSSSSTSRSYCSRSILLESGSPQSPPGMFSL